MKLAELETNNIKKEPSDESRIAKLEKALNDVISENKKFKDIIKDHEKEINNLRTKVKMKGDIVNDLNKHVKEIKPIQGGGQKRLRASSSLNYERNNHRMRL